MNDGPNNNVLIFDSGADQSTCGGPAWNIENMTGEFIRCNGYLKGDQVSEGPILPVVTAITLVDIKGEEPSLFRIHLTCYYDDPK